MIWQWIVMVGAEPNHDPEDLESAYSGAEVWADDEQGAAEQARAYLREHGHDDLAGGVISVRPLRAAARLKETA